MENSILSLWDLPESKVYLKIKSPVREEFFSYLASKYGGYRRLSKRMNLTTDGLFKKKTGRYFASLKLIKKLLDICPPDKKSLFKKEMESHIEAIKAQSSSNYITSPNLPMKFSPTLARIAGHLIGDGGIKYDNIVHYTGNCVPLLNEFKNDVITIVGDTKCGEYRHRRIEDKTVWFSVIVGLLLKTFFGNNSHNFKTVPTLILNADKESKSMFLRALFDDESHVNVKTKTIMFKMANRPVIRIAKTLLNELGIKAGSVSKTRGSENEKFRHLFYISGKENLDRFYTLVGFSDPEKKNKLTALLKGYTRKR